jgi:ElaA protein
VTSAGPEVHRARADELDARTIYRILRLRAEVFVVEQECAFLDLDGRDLQSGSEHLWIDEDPLAPAVTAYLRLLALPGGQTEIGRVVCDAKDRHRGLGRLLMEKALTVTGPPHWLKAQTRMSGWYTDFGFVRDGADFDEDGISHTPMRRP